jgi:hypothetical protein
MKNLLFLKSNEIYNNNILIKYTSIEHNFNKNLYNKLYCLIKKNDELMNELNYIKYYLHNHD